MTRAAKLLVVAGLLIGAVLGVFVSQYAPVFGGFATIGQPWSQARQSLIGTHVLAFAATGAVLGFLVTWLRTKQAAGQNALAIDADGGEGVDEEPGAPPPGRTARRRQPLLLAAAIAGVIVLTVGGISAFGRPNFTCHVGSACAGMGFCTGAGWSCVVGGNDDCLRSEGCRRDGQCTATTISGETGAERFCLASSDAECAKAEACRASKECFQSNGSCTTLERRDEERTRQNAVKDRTGIGLGEFLGRAARGENTTIDVASFFVAENLEGYAVDDPTPRIVSLENATIQFGDRRIPAVVIEANFTSINRAESRKRELCIHVAAARDKERGMWRQVIAKGCGKPGSEDAITQWKAENGFVSADGRASPPPHIGGGSAAPAREDSPWKVGQLVVNGRLPPEVVRRIVTAKLADLQNCLGDQQGPVEVKFVIDRAGAISLAKVTTPTPAAACVEGVVQSLAFPEPDGGIVTVVCPLVR